MADGKITLEELTKALHDAITDRNIRLAGQDAFNNVPEEPKTIELDMEAFNRSARAISIRRERTVALMRNSRLLPSSDINLGMSNSSVGGGSFFPYRRATVARPHTSIRCYDSGLCYRAAGQCIDHCESTYCAPVICNPF